MYSSTAGTGRNWASSGSHSRAAKLMPSDIGIQIFSCSTTRWGRSFSRFIAALGASLGGQPASSGSGVQTQTAQATATPGRKRPFAYALRLIARMQSSALLGGATTALVLGTGTRAQAQQEPKRGGRFRLGVSGANTGDSYDPATWG